MDDQAIVVLASDAGERGLPLPYVSAVIRWLKGKYEADLRVAAQVTEDSTLVTVSGDSMLVESWLVERCNDRHPGPGSRMTFDGQTALIVKRYAIVAPPPRRQQNHWAPSDSVSDDFMQMIDMVAKMTALSIQDF
jgi:hypothetical protein